MDQNLNVSKNEFNGLLLHKHNVKVIADAIEKGTAPFLMQNGKIDTNPIYSLNNGICLGDMNLLLVKIKQQEIGTKSNVVGTFTTLDSLKILPKEKSSGTAYTFRNSKDEYKTARFYFPEETKEPAKMQEMNFKIKYPPHLENKTYKVETASDYLPAYYAAAESGLKIQVTPEIIEDFKKEILAVAKNELAKEKDKNISSSLRNYCVQADVKAKEIIKSFKEQKVENKTENSKTKEKAKQYKRNNEIER